jgi:hypothetical protein
MNVEVEVAIGAVIVGDDERTPGIVGWRECNISQIDWQSSGGDSVFDDFEDDAGFK